MKPTTPASIPSAAPAASSTAKAWPVPLWAFLLAFAVFAPAITCGLVNLDDGPSITDNPLVMADSPWAALPACFTTFQQAMYAPLLWCSYALDAILFRATPAALWGSTWRMSCSTLSIPPFSPSSSPGSARTASLWCASQSTFFS